MDLSADKIRALPFIVEPISLHLMVPKTKHDAQAFISKFNRAFTEMKKAGRIEEWTQSYLETINSGTKTTPEERAQTRGAYDD